MKLLFLAPAIFLVVTSGAHAQHMNAHDSPCRDKVSTVDLASCLNDAYNSADKALNQSYAAITKALQSNEQKALLTSQRSWLQYRDAECAAQSELYAGGTASGPVHLACLEAITRQRIAELEIGFGWRRRK
jgi:uncharacterized protein YecT (DUF1311 family)